MANTNVPVGVGSVVLSALDLLAGEGAIVTDDFTTEFVRKYALRDEGDATTQIRFALDKAWKLAHSPSDINIVYLESV